ncbi:acyltransferase [Fulvivirgaceae bacterium PWU4]|uniref:Acyltransferase n=1 Tax=Chryseosolibacter histidini TaxID=2782349 RepID=A0AAP2DJG7_9BACT|nr:acyltransferase [Chryseosolibacter histidini]MBT1697415.1 acyltransferase [Chryseosolibacter histidini]
MTTFTEERSYHFADFIRFVAMCAIIFQHSFIVEKAVLISDAPSVITFFFLKVMAKIGSISFFLVSGFLLSSALERYSSKEYLNKRVKNIFKPYVLFVFLYLMLDMAGAFFGEQKITSLTELPAFVAGKLLGILFFTSYWFIFNYFISVMLLLLLRKYLYEPWLGVVLFCCTMVYAINVHLEWFTPHHTTAFVGFTFFLWLGANLKKYEEGFWRLIDGTPWWKLIAAVLITLGVNFYETFYLLETAATVVDSSLKVTNILYCFAVFMLLSKIGINVRFGFMNPRDETYPLYLIHPIFLKVINYAVLPLLPSVKNALTINDPSEISWLAILLYQAGWFIGIYTLSLVAVKVILNSPFRWVFGKQGKAVISPAQYFRIFINGVKNLKFR